MTWHQLIRKILLIKSNIPPPDLMILAELLRNYLPFRDRGKLVLQLNISSSSHTSMFQTPVRQILHHRLQKKLPGSQRAAVSAWYLEDLVGVAHGGDFVVGVGSSQLAQVTHGPSADLTVHVHLLHLMLRTHEHLIYLKNNSHVCEGHHTHTQAHFSVLTAFYLHSNQK